LIKSSDNASLSCVGDDWQSIYRFSGSDINYTGKFEDYFGYTKKIELDKTFRFNDKINSFATTFITENPAQLKKDITSYTHTDSNAITLVQYYQDVDRAIQECVKDISSNGSHGKSIYILGRYSFSKPSFLQTHAGKYPQFNFSYDTVHASKGKEADYVIVVDVNDEGYGFPAKIVNDPLLDLVLPPAEPYEYAEERRLFYVAVTRSKNHSYILYDIEKPSVFVQEVLDSKDKKYSFNEIITEGIKSAPPDYGNCPSCVTGKLRRKESRFGKFFFGCIHYPLCSFIPKTCEGCNKYPLVRSGNIYKCLNPDCSFTAKACQRCDDGIMVKRKGKYGVFWGCSNFAKTKCQYTEKIPH
jgi:DNA helicase-4